MTSTELRDLLEYQREAATREATARDRERRQADPDFQLAHALKTIEQLNGEANELRAQLRDRGLPRAQAELRATKESRDAVARDLEVALDKIDQHEETIDKLKARLRRKGKR